MMLMAHLVSMTEPNIQRYCRVRRNFDDAGDSFTVVNVRRYIAEFAEIPIALSGTAYTEIYTAEFPETLKALVAHLMSGIAARTHRCSSVPQNFDGGTGGSLTDWYSHTHTQLYSSVPQNFGGSFTV